MPEQTSVTSYIKLPHSELNGQYGSKILEIAKDKLNNTSTEEGYILDVVNIDKVLENKIKNMSVVFKVKLNTLCIKLTIGLTVTASVSLIFPHGIFADLYSVKFFIHEKSLSKYEYDDTEKNFKKKKKTKKSIDDTICIGDDIKIKIVNLKFENGNYKCISEVC